MRDLSPEEAKQVDSQAKQERPPYYNSETGELVSIGKDFEVWLILTPMGTRARIANFLQLILDNDINDWPSRKSLLEEWLDNEIDDIKKEISGYSLVIDTYEEIRDSLLSSTQGFEDIDELNKLTVDLATSIGSNSERREALRFSKAVANVLSSRANGEIPEETQQEMKSWIRLLLTY